MTVMWAIVYGFVQRRLGTQTIAASAESQDCYWKTVVTCWSPRQRSSGHRATKFRGSRRCPTARRLTQVWRQSTWTLPTRRISWRTTWVTKDSMTTITSGSVWTAGRGSGFNSSTLVNLPRRQLSVSSTPLPLLLSSASVIIVFFVLSLLQCSGLVAKTGELSP